MARLTISLLGTPQIELDGRPIQVETRKAIALLAYLVCAGRPVERDELAALLWPGSSQARGVLRRTLAALNQAIGKQWLVANRHSIGLQEEQSPPDELWVDVAHFQQNLAAASLLPPPQKWPLLAETAALYRGRFLQGFTLADSRAFDDWQLWQSEQLSAQANALYDELVRSYRQQGALKTAVRYARQWVALEPWHEPAQRQLILSLALAGERAAALQQYQTCQRLLAEELGVAPQAETVALFEQIRGDKLAAQTPANWHEHRPVPIHLPPLPQPLTPFVGWEQEVATLTALLAEQPRAARPLVLYGEAGVGKSRLALEVANRLAGRWREGVAWVSLSSNPTTLELAPLLALFPHAPREQPLPVVQQWLCRQLDGRQLLVVLDGFTPTPQAWRMVQGFVAGATEFALLITTCQRPDRPTGRFYEVHGFPCSPAGALQQAPLGQLFLQRAQQLLPGFEWQEEEEPLLARLCALVGGNPAAIQRAATWLRLLPLAEIVAQVEEDPYFLRRESR